MEAKSPLVLVSGTGTGIGKTHVACALVRVWGELRQVIGYKPVETGVPPQANALGEDAAALAKASTFHVKHDLFHETFEPPLSPHLAARQAARPVDVARIARQVADLRRLAQGVVVELAGGLFSPLTDAMVNAELAKLLDPDALFLVAPDRIGVLHDVGAALRAARAERLAVSGVVLSAPAEPDPSTGTNEAELERVVGVRVLSRFPRAAPLSGETQAAARRLVETLALLG